MDIPLDEVIYVEGIASSSTGAAADADSTPTFAVYEEATDTDIGVGGNMTKRTSLTGDYRASFTASAANGFEAGKWYAVIGSATIGGIATKGILARFRIVVAENVAGVPKADMSHLLGTAPTESAGGRLAGGVTKFFNVAGPTGTLLSLPDALPDAADGTGLMTTNGFLASIGAIKGTVEDHASNSASQFQSDLAEATDNHYGDSAGGNVVAFVTGANTGQCSRCNGYTGSSGTLTFADPFSVEPTAGDKFIILGRIET